ncbi:hypothetical protein QCA50_009025 [Cerrena zonata]|uniref:Cytochrome P450 n=1 Tax=Cerrena zonata TaxID=2478898 RepID=A0AAW0G4L0_9APHY
MDAYYTFVLPILMSSVAVWQLYNRLEPTGFVSSVTLLLGIPAALSYHLALAFSSTWSAVTSVFLLYWSSLVTLIALYRISSFHPLARYPGPLPCKISKGWMSYIAARKDMHRYVNGLHAKYGDVVRIGPNELSFRHGDLIEPILANKDLRKGPYYNLRTRDGVSSIDGTKDYSEHAARRRLWDRGLGAAMTKVYMDSLVNVVSELMQKLSNRQNEVVDISQWLSLAGFDFMGKIIFSVSFDMVKNEHDHNGLIKLVQKTTYICHILAQISWIYPYLLKIPGAAGTVKTARRIGVEMAEKRKNLGSNSYDLYHYLLDEEGLEKVKPSERFALREGFVAIIAGSETTATAATNTLYFLLKHPDVKRRLQKEIREVFPENGEISDCTKFNELPFLNACINESLRLLPPGLTGLQRQVDPRSGGKMLGSYFVPAGTNVSAHLYSIQRDPRYFSPLADTFWPDRWLSQDHYTLPSGEVITKDNLIHNRDVFLPFSTGQQNCAGKNVANMELRSLLVALLNQFDIEPAEGFRVGDYEEGLADVYVTLRGPLYVQLRSVH